MIGKQLGHNKIDTTARYAHLARDSIKASLARVRSRLHHRVFERLRNEHGFGGG